MIRKYLTVSILTVLPLLSPPAHAVIKVYKPGEIKKILDSDKEPRRGIATYFIENISFEECVKKVNKVSEDVKSIAIVKKITDKKNFYTIHVYTNLNSHYLNCFGNGNLYVRTTADYI